MALSGERLKQLSAGVALGVDGLQAAVFDVGVDLRRADAGVAEEFLQGADFGAAGQHVRREAVTHRVRADFLRDADAGGILLDEFPDDDSVEGPPPPRDEQRFKTFARNSQRPESIWYCAYPDLSIKNVGNNLKIHEGLFGDSDVSAWLNRL